MKKYIYLYLMLMTSVVLVSCSGDEGPGAEREPDLDDEFVAQREETVLGGATARFLITHDLTKEVAAEVHAAVTKSLNYGLEEACYFREILTRDEGWAKIVAESEKGEGIAGLFSQGGTGKYGLTADDITRLIEGDYQIYWPYSEYWDGETLPAVTFVPELADSIQVFYGSTGYQISDAGVEKIVVDEDLLREGAVWVVSIADIPYAELPDFNAGEREKDGVCYLGRRDADAECDRPTMAPQSESGKLEPWGKFCLGKFMADYQFDKWCRGGSEFDISFTQYSGDYISTLKELREVRATTTTIRFVRTRDDIRSRRWIDFNDFVLEPRWYDNEDGVFSIREINGGERITQQFVCTMGVGGEKYGFLSEDYDIERENDVVCYRNSIAHFMVSNPSINNPGVPFGGPAMGIYWTHPLKTGRDRY